MGQKSVKLKKTPQPSPPEVFSSAADALHEFFLVNNQKPQRIKLKKLHQISEKCEKLQTAIGQYFQQNYQTKLVITEENGEIVFIQLNDQSIKYFSRYVDNIEIKFPTGTVMNNRVASFINLECSENMRKIQFHGEWTQSFGQQIHDILENIESVEIRTFISSVSDILDHCQQIKYLKMKIRSDIDIRSPANPLPTLSTFEFRPHIWNQNTIDGLTSFFQQIPNVKRFSCGQLPSTEMVKQLLTILIENSDIAELFLELKPMDLADIEKELKILNDRSTFERLELKMNVPLSSDDSLESIVALTSLKKFSGLHVINQPENTCTLHVRIPKCDALNNLKILQFWNCDVYEDCFVDLAQNLPILEEFYYMVHDTNADIKRHIGPFVRYCGVLNTIILQNYWIVKVKIDIACLNKERKRLFESRPDIVKTVVHFVNCSQTDLRELLNGHENDLVDLKRSKVTQINDVERPNPLIHFSVEDL